MMKLKGRRQESGGFFTGAARVDEAEAVCEVSHGGVASFWPRSDTEFNYLDS